MIDEKMQKIYGTLDIPSDMACEVVDIVSVESPTGRKTINKVDMQPTDKLYVKK